LPKSAFKGEFQIVDRSYQIKAVVKDTGDGLDNAGTGCQRLLTCQLHVQHKYGLGLNLY